MRFASPVYLWLLAPYLAGIIAFFWWASRKRNSLLTQFVPARLLAELLAGVSPGRRKLKQGVLVLSGCLLLIALARPQWGFSWQEVRTRGLDILVAVDTSRSMLASDIAPTRLARAQLSALDLMNLARRDRLGLIAFAGTAFLQCPLTIDDSAFRQSVEMLDVGIIPQGGTALEPVIRTAMTTLKEGENHKVLVILTDGEDHEPGAVEAATEAAEAGLRIFTIGIGSAEGEILQHKDDAGAIQYVRDEQGNVVKSRLNESLLQQVATAGRGFYLPLRGAKTMDTLYEKGLAPLPKSENREKFVQRFHEQFHWPLGIAILLLILERFLPERRREPALSRKLAAAFLALSLTHGAWASPQQARKQYESGRFRESLKEYQSLMRKDEGTDPRLPYNAGAAAYRSGQYNEAARLFGMALNTPDLELQQQAYYNRGNALYQAGEQQQDPRLRRQAWQQSLQDFTASLKLNSADADALHNQHFVKQKLQELQQRQQPSNQKPQDNQKPPDQDEQQTQEQQPNQSPGNEQEQQGNQQQSSNSPQEQPQPQTASNQEQNSSPEQQPSNEPATPKEGTKQESKPNPEDKQPGTKPEDTPHQSQPGKAQEAATSSGEMTEDQALRLLDAQEGETRLMPFGPAAPAERKVKKDW